jgi:hypothetical protein
MDSTVNWSLSYRDGEEQQIWSWDNQLAYDLYQSGVVGLSASLLLYGGLLLGVYRGWKTSPWEEKPFMACLLASLVAYTFMLSNVLMFTKPVNFLFWTIGAVAYTFAWKLQPEAVPELEEGVSFVEGDPEPARG